MTIFVRLFAASDRASLLEAIDLVCGGDCWMRTRRFEPTPSWTHALDAPSCPHHRLLVAEEAGRIVGWCRLFPSDGGCGCDSIREVGIGLLKNYRGQGIGKLLLAEALGWAGARGFQQAKLLTRADNMRAIRLFEYFGFQIVDETTDARLQMTCRLSSLGG